MPDRIPVRAGTLVVLCGTSGSGKSTFAAQHFLPTEIVSSDECRAMLCDDPTNQRVSGSAFRLMYWIAGERLHFRRTTVVDSTALDRRARKDLLKIAAEHGAPTMLLLFNVDKETSIARDRRRPRPVGEEVIERQYSKVAQAIEDAENELWDQVHVFTPDNIDSTRIMRQLGDFDQRHLEGPFDIIGDVHGCMDELIEVLDKLGYRLGGSRSGDFVHPDGRTLIFLGDLGDRGPHSADVFSFVMDLVDRKIALYTPGNHCSKLFRYLRGNRVSLTFGLAETVADVEARERAEPGFRERLRHFIGAAPTYLWLDDGKVVVAHAGIKENMIGKENAKVRAMVIYGDTTGETNPDGTPVRLDWAKDYNGQAAVVYGHTPVAGPSWHNNTINIDQGCVFGGWLTALRWPEREVVRVRARHAYYSERTPHFIADAAGPTANGEDN